LISSRTFGALALLALIPSWLGLLGGWYWCLDLFAHFRWQYLVAGAAVLAWAAWRGRRLTMVAAALTCMLNGALIGQLAWHPGVSNISVAEGPALRVLSLNVLTSNPNTQAVLDHLLASDADVIFLMEVNQQWMTALAPLQARYPHRVAHPRSDNFGVALFSRLPLAKTEVLLLGEAGLPAIEARMTHQGRDFVFIGTHPPPPGGRDIAAERDRQLAQLAEHVASMPTPVLVMGDLNATPWSAGMRIATGRNLGFRSRSAPWTPTWRAASIFAIPIDHALCTAPLVIVGRSVGSDVGSDHRSLNVSVNWAR
jgi:endonuclease/exonuclease/phosphatase (EEP) superfamily protein YafD